MRAFFDKMAGFKTYLILVGMMILAAVEQFTGVQIPTFVYEFMGLGAGVTAKMAIDRMADDVKKPSV